MNKSSLVKLSLPALFIISIATVCTPNIFHTNSGTSISYGTPGNGHLENAWQIDYKLDNARYFSPLSYFVFDNGFMHSSLCKTLLAAYKECEETCEGTNFRIMECSSKKGGKQLLHRTHRNGLSVDFMVPKIKHDKQYKFYDRLGLWHYLLGFDSKGRLKLNKNVQTDFETMARHIVALDNAARINGLRISKVILKINLKDDFFSTPTGKEVRNRNIYFARNLSPAVDKMHDDHYHVDFELAQK